MKKGKNNKKKVAVLATALALLTLGAGTFAWTSYTEWAKNHLQSKGFEEGKVSIVEDFKPGPIDDPNKPAEIEKQVNVINTSDTDALVRISFEEMLHKLAAGAKATVQPTATTGNFPVIVDNAMYTDPAKYADITDTATTKFEITTGGVAQTDADLVTNNIIGADDSFKLYQEIGNPGHVVLVFKKYMATSEFPTDFDFKANAGVIPTLEGDFAQELTPAEVSAGKVKGAYVAQKVNATLIKTTAAGVDTYTVVTETGQSNSLGFYDYGVGLAGLADSDWAGASVNVAGPSVPQVIGKVQTPGGNPSTASKVDETIKLTQSNVITFLPGTPNDISANHGKWFYNVHDGYYYYLGALASGATTDTPVLDKITFPDVKEDQTFKMASYNLWVGLEAINNTTAGMTAATIGGGGAFTGTGTVEGNRTWESNGAGWGLLDDAALGAIASPTDADVTSNALYHYYITAGYAK